MGKKQVRNPKVTLDRWFSYFIRLRDSLDGGWNGKSIDGVGKCRTCGKLGKIRYMDCGHFQPREKIPTRFNEKNCHLQCKFCNNNSEKGRKGEQYKMSLYIDKTYGPGTAEQLLRLSKSTSKFGNFEMQSLIPVYQEKVKRFK